MPVVSVHIYYVGTSAYDLRKVSSAVEQPDDLVNVYVRFIDEPRTVLVFDAVTFLPAWEASLNATGGGGGTFVNPNPTTVSVGGIPAGTTFPIPQTMQQMWNALLYPYAAPSFSAFSISGQNSPFEVGYTLPANPTFLWSTNNSGNIIPNTIDLVEVTGGPNTLASGLANDGSQAVVLGAIQKLVVASHQFRIDGTNTLLAPFSRFLTLNWQWGLRYGTSVNTTLTSGQINSLVSTVLTGSYARNYGFAAGGYKYICQADAAGGQLNSVKDANTNFDVPMAAGGAYSNVDGGGFSYALVSYTNPYGVVTNYRVYRTFNSLGGAITLAVT
jgi:hypothetical protein